MRRNKFTEEQIAYALKQAELGIAVEEVCRRMGISNANFFKWRQNLRLDAKHCQPHG
jgi:putative transposase